MAILAASSCGIKLSKILQKIHKIKSVPGRLESVANLNNSSNIVVDFGATDGTGIQYYLITQSNEISSSAHWTELRPPVTSLGHFSVNYDLRRLL